MSKKNRGYGVCAYCLKEDELSEDHVTPQCLYTKGRPGDIPKVGACETCNNKKKSANDTYLRDFLFHDIDSSTQPIPQQLYEKFARGILEHGSEFARHAVSQSQLVEIYKPSGIFAGWAYALEIPDNRMKEILSMMVRGLYRAYTGGTLPEQSSFDVGRRRDKNTLEIDVRVLHQMGARYVPVGNGEVFECLYGCVKERPEVSIWHLCFYRRVFFSVITNQQALQSPQKAS